jgi:CRISPR-associated Csx14 family protein
MDETIKENRRISAEKIARGEYDVFISYNHKDRDRVIEIAKLLKDNSIAPWLNEWDLQPGLPWQAELEHRIKEIKSAAIFVGQIGMSSWHKKEMYAFEREFEKRSIPVIPVLLPDIVSTEELPIFLEGMTWVDFRKKDPDPLERLIWGITGKKPAKVYRPGILIASLGDSPVVVPSMYRLLMEKEHLTIEQVTILHPIGDDVQMACELIDTFFPDKQKLHYEPMEFKDADSWLNACRFLNQLYKLLQHYQKQGETVYLSLAGGRKSMAALMAWVVPFFSCVQGLYHVIDPKNSPFQSASEIQGRPTAEQPRIMKPDLDRLTLVEIPFVRGQQISERLFSLLHSPHPDDYEKAEALITGQAILQQGDMQQVFVTELVVEQFRELCKRNSVDAQEVRNGLLEMSKTTTLQAHEADPVPEKLRRTLFHYFTGLQVPIRPVFYTLPEDVYAHPGVQVARVIICSLEEPGINGYKSLKEVTKLPNFLYKKYSSIDVLPPIPSPANSILIVPLGKSPMVATQLYTLLREQEQHTIHEVVLLYPQLSTEIHNGADMIWQALREEHNILCTRRGIPDLEDIVSTEDCQLYQAHLESEIKRIKQQYPDHKIDLALSGGRKGMTAMTIFAAQNQEIPYVYHTLIPNDEISEEIEYETTIEALNVTRLSKNERNNRLFLRAYKAEGYNPYAYFTLFRVPVFNANGW